jgi:hypothetical protein
VAYAYLSSCSSIYLGMACHFTFETARKVPDDGADGSLRPEIKIEASAWPSRQQYRWGNERNKQK